MTNEKPIKHHWNTNKTRVLLRASFLALKSAAIGVCGVVEFHPHVGRIYPSIAILSFGISAIGDVLTLIEIADRIPPDRQTKAPSIEASTVQPQ